MRTINTLKHTHGKRLLNEIAKLEKQGITVEFEPQNEDIEPSHNMDNQKAIDWVIQSYEAGNMAAWFCAKVTVKYRGLSADDYLGCCSYKSFKDFQTDAYYGDMINQCIRQINSEIADINTETCRKFAIRQAKKLVEPFGYKVVQVI